MATETTADLSAGRAWRTLLIIVTTFGLVWFAPIHGSLSGATALAQDQAKVTDQRPLARIAGLIIQKGYKNTSIGQLCARFMLSEENPNCVGYDLASDDQDPYIYSFYAFNNSTGKTRIILVIQKANVGDAFLTGFDGNLEAVAHGLKNGLWQWQRTSITPTARAGFQKVSDYWKSQESDIAALSDRKD